MLYQMILPREGVVALITQYYSDIYPVCREQVFKAKLEETPFPVVTASLSTQKWDELAEDFGIFTEDVYPDPDGVYAGKDVIWFAECSDPKLPFFPERLNIFIYSDPYKELK